jgi:hypothetical protein
MYADEIETTLSLFRAKGIRVKSGMTDAQLDEAEKCFGFSFPDDYRALLKAALPVSQGFCDWTDLSEDNISFIRGKLEDPFMNVLFRVKQKPFHWHGWGIEVVGGGWPEAWGQRPRGKNQRLNFAKEKIQSAPPLIPVFNDDYISGIPTNDNNPVFSISIAVSAFNPEFGDVAGLDIWNYFRREFSEKKSLVDQGPAIEWQFLKEIPFWSEVFR